MYETEGFGVPPWGAANRRRVVRITRVVVGADAVADAAGSELIQFGPGFSCGQSENFLPPKTKLLSWARGSSSPPPTPAHNTMINECTLVEGGGLFADRKKHERPGCGWEGELFAASSKQELQTCSNGRTGSANGREGRNIIIRDTPAAVDEKTRSGESGSLPPPTKSAHTFSLSSSLCAASKTHDDPNGSAHRAESIGGGAGGGGQEACVGTTEVGDAMARIHDDCAFHFKDEGTAAELPSPEEDDRAKPTTSQQAGTTADEEAGNVAPKLSIQIDAVKMSESYMSEDGSSHDREGGQGVGQLHHHLRDVGCARVGQALASSGGDSSVWNDDNTCCTMLSATTFEKASCNSSLSDVSLEQLASKRSFSSHDTERYGGNLSKDATDILRSHLESESKLSDTDNIDMNAPFPDSHDGVQRETAALMSPVPPPTPSAQASDPTHFTVHP